MPRKKTLANIPTKVMRRKKPINLEHLKTIEPLTDNQEKIWKAYGEGKTLCSMEQQGQERLSFLCIFRKT